MAITSIDENRARRAAQRAIAPDPLEYVGAGEPKSQKVLGVDVVSDLAPDSEKKGLVGRFVQDAALMAHGVLALPGIAYDKGVWGTVKMLGGGLLQTGKDIIGVTGVLGREQQKESLEYYKEHPGFAVADVLG